MGGVSETPGGKWGRASGGISRGEGGRSTRGGKLEELWRTKEVATGPVVAMESPPGARFQVLSPGDPWKEEGCSGAPPGRTGHQGGSGRTQEGEGTGGVAHEMGNE